MSFRLFVTLALVLLGTPTLAQDREPSRLSSSILGFTSLSEDLTDSHSALSLQCGKDGVHLRTILHENDISRKALKGAKVLTTRTIVSAQTPDGHRAFFGFDSEAKENGSGRYLSDYVPKSGTSKRLRQYDTFSWFLTVYFAPEVTLSVWSAKVDRSGTVGDQLLNIQRSINRDETLGPGNLTRFRDFCQMAADNRLGEIDAPECIRFGDRDENFGIMVEYDDDVLAGRFDHEFAGELSVYGEGSLLELSGKKQEANSGQIELRMTDELEILYKFPSIGGDLDVTDFLKKQSGTDKLGSALKADPVSLRLLMPDGTLLSASEVTADTVSLPRTVFAKLKTNADIKVTGVSAKGTVKFSETIDLAGFAEAFDRMLAQLGSHRAKLEEMQVCRRINGELHFIFD